MFGTEESEACEARVGRKTSVLLPTGGFTLELQRKLGVNLTWARTYHGLLPQGHPEETSPGSSRAGGTEPLTALIPASKGALNYRRRVQELSEVSPSTAAPHLPSPSQWGPWALRRGREKGLGSSRHPSGRLPSFLGLVLLPPPSLFYIEG